MSAANKSRVTVARIESFGAKALAQLAGIIGAPAARVAAPTDRYTKVSAAGKLLPKSATEWEGVYEAATGLVWGRKLLPGEFTWANAMKAASKATLCGAPARAPTVRERFCLSEFDRESPALDTNYFDPSETSGWEWTSTEAPSGYAWVVGLGYGNSDRGYRSFRDHVRAVRAGQLSDFGL